MEKFKIAPEDWRGCNFNILGADMAALTEITKMLGGMTPAALIALVILAGFGLAAYAIYAVVKVAGKGSSGD
jgi:hypothetical protein